jgi:hypothetical protein
MDDVYPTAAESPPEPPREGLLRGPTSPARWFRWLVARNPFYPLSAALLLFGINRLSVDPTFLSREEQNLVFNFSALQLYEILLVIVALFLAGRRLHYDSTMLVVIENGLVFVPFILITQAVLIGREMAARLCVAAAVLAGLRFLWIRRAKVLMPGTLLLAGVLLLLFNVALPFVYRSQMEQFVENWLVPGRFCWLVLLPALLGLANALPRPGRWAEQPHQRSWLPLLMLGLWIGATAVHLRCIDYISNLPFELALIAPTLWAACWTAYFRIGDFTPDAVPKLKAALLVLSALLPFVDTGMGYTYLALQGLNVIFFAMIALRSESRAAWHMFLASLALVLAGTPEYLATWLAFSRQELLLAALVFYLALRSMLSGNVALGFAGALAVALSPAFLLHEYPFLHLAVQTGATFLLVHSFRWDEPEQPGAAQLRRATVLIWSVDSIMWTWMDASAFRVVATGALIVLSAVGVSRWIRGSWPAGIVTAGAAISLLAAPVHYLVDKARSSPTGLVAVIGSFLLFGFGTVAALTRNSWNHSASRIDK